MKISKIIILQIIFGLVSVLAYSQTTTISPYSGFGVGDLTQATLSRNFGMGGVGVAVADRYAINRMNPASYSELWRFTFDITGFYQSTIFKTSADQNKLETGGFQGFSMVMKKKSPLAFAVGINPYSSIGYEFVQTRTLPALNNVDTFAYTSKRAGDGGLNEAYAGISHQFWKRKIGLGLNVKYIFGKIQSIWETNVTTSAPPQIESRTNLKGFGLQLGAIYGDTLTFLDSALVFRVGVTADLVPSIKMDQTTTLLTPGYDPYGVVIYYADTVKQNGGSKISLPNQYGFGLSIGRAGKYTIAADLIYQDWSKFTHFQNQKLTQSLRSSIGIEFIPDIFAYKKFFSRMAYRAGVTYEKTYFNINDRNINRYSVALGIGIPLTITSLSRVSVGFEYGIRGTSNYGLIQENSMRFVIGVSFVEPWFNPRKYE